MLQGICAAAVILSLASAPTPSFVDGAHGPTGKLMLTRPTLAWNVSVDRIASVEARVNGETMIGMFDPREGVALASPSTDLLPGSYETEFTLKLTNGQTVRKSWSFEVLPGAYSAFPPANSAQRQAVDRANQFRARLGLPALREDRRLHAAAHEHSVYLSLNNASGHFQSPKLRGFWGESPGDRLGSFGFSTPAFECVDFGGSTPAEGMENLPGAPYHRLPFMQPGTSSIGAGYVDRRLTVEIGETAVSGIVVSPAPGETGVPTKWDYVERPNPLRLHGFPKITGHVIVLAHFAPNSPRLTVLEAKLEQVGGGEVPVWLNTPANDEHLSGAMFIIPRQPLKALTSYRATVRAMSSDGTPIHRVWAFETADVEVPDVMLGVAVALAISGLPGNLV